jgi:uncharacterized damage-inducible protein DinB
MTDDDRRSVLETLAEALPALKAELEGLNSGQLTYRPESGAWSILDCVEHIATTESGMFHLIARGSSPASAQGEGREGKYFRGVLNRARKFSAPAGLQPTQQYPSAEAALEAFAERRARTIRYIEETTDDLRARTTVHPVAGEVTCRECLALLMGHPLRHLEQIREIKATPGFPRAADHLGTS